MVEITTRSSSENAETITYPAYINDLQAILVKQGYEFISLQDTNDLGFALLEFIEALCEDDDGTRISG